MFAFLVSENFYNFIDLVNTSFYWKDISGRYLGCNKHMLNLVGLTKRKDVIGKTDFDFLNLEDALKIQANDRIAMRKGLFQGEEGLTLANGIKVVYWTIKNQLRDDQGKVIGVAGNSFNVDEHKTHAELEKQRASLNEKVQIFQIIDSANASIYWKDAQTERYMGCNQYMLNMFGVKSREEISGKTLFDIMPREEAQRLDEIDRFVLENGHYEGEERFTIASGEEKIYHTVKTQLVDSSGNVIGLVGTSLDITDKKETERRLLESERQRHQMALQEKENFAKLARKVAHDINSPLAALNMMLDVCNELPEDRRSFLRRATESILDIANNLLTNNDKEESLSNADIEFREPLLVSDLLIHLLSEKKVEHKQRAVKFETVISNDAQFAFIQMQKTEFRRAMSNLINNAVDALAGKEKGERAHQAVAVHLTANADFVFVKVQDNGKGMQRDHVGKIIARQGFTEGKENGHGLGLQQVWDMLECNDGMMSVESELSQGTSIQLTFPRTAAPKWIAQEIHFNADSVIVILDDDESIHTAWNMRFAPFFSAHPNMRLKHFTQGQESLDFVNKLPPNEKEQVIFLSDYELLDEDRNGLQILEASKIKDAILVTSYYSQSRLRDAAARLNIKILPKHMASVIPIEVAE